MLLTIWSKGRSIPTKPGFVDRKLRMNRINFQFIANQALLHVCEFLGAWLPGGRIIGREYIARNPTRDDKHLGSFRVNLHSGRWADFATNDSGGDLIGLYAYLNNISQARAAIFIASKMGLNPAVLR